LVFRNNPDLADSWLWELSEKITSLSKLPKRCPISSESEAFDVDVRQLIFGNKPHIYRILFSIQEEKVFILRVRSIRQQNLTNE
jgi:hypothetical protein